MVTTKTDLSARIAADLKTARRVRDEIAEGLTLFTTAEAVDACPFEIEAESLLAYPSAVLPRTKKNPRATRPTYLFDPRDILALPAILRAWDQARDVGCEAEFFARRQNELLRRDLKLLGIEEAA